MTTAVSEALLEEAVALARAAGDLTLPWFRSTELQIDRKDDGTPVTAADRAAERHVRAELEARYPDDGVVGEEEAVREGTSGRRWILDPIDGTKAFTRGVPLYSTLLAVEDGDGLAIGVIHLPALGETIYAGRGLGCFWNGRHASVSERSTVNEAYLTTSGLSDWPAGTLPRLQAAGVSVRTWGDGYGYALVATGRVEAMVDHTASLWDLAPMPVIIREAGGRFTDLAGNERADGGSGLATNGHVHDDVLRLLTG